MKEINMGQGPIISDHGYERILERTHCKRNEVTAFIEKVWKTGRDGDSYKSNSPIGRYIANVGKRSGQHRCIRVKGNSLYIFNSDGTVFVTCYDIPQKVIQDKKNRRGF